MSKRSLAKINFNLGLTILRLITSNLMLVDIILSESITI